MVIKIGQRDCYECGGKGTVTLLIDKRGIWSRCERCKFTEWEWTWGDNPEYLDYLAKRFGVKREDLEKKLEEVL
jgi:hypothetical protein